jgi:hypothetical protein
MQCRDAVSNLRRRNVRTHHGASYRPDGEATTTHRRPRFIEMALVVAVSTIGRSVERPYIAPRLILTQHPKLVDDSSRLYLRGSTLRAITFTKKLRCAPFLRSHPSPLLTPLSRRLQSRRHLYINSPRLESSYQAMLICK